MCHLKRQPREIYSPDTTHFYFILQYHGIFAQILLVLATLI